MLHHWRIVENHSTPDFRNDIRSCLPVDLTWYLCEVEPQDSDRLFIISSDDWADVSGRLFRVAEVAARLDVTSSNKDTVRIIDDIRRKIQFVEMGGKLDSMLITITDNPTMLGPFTIIEGNRRSVTFYRLCKLFGSIIFVGYSQEVVNCKWARYTYSRINKKR